MWIVGSRTVHYMMNKYLKNIICLLMEVSQGIFLTTLLVIAMNINLRYSDSMVPDFYQDAGIWIVIASCVAEYLLLLTYIGIAIYEFVKNRKSKVNLVKKKSEGF